MTVQIQGQGHSGAEEEPVPATEPPPPSLPASGAASSRARVDPAVEGALRAWWRSEFRRGYQNGRRRPPR
jgi:hypothetical protein